MVGLKQDHERRVTVHRQDLDARRDGYVAGRDLHLHLPGQQLSLYPEERFTTPLTYDRARPIFLQYLNPEIRSCYGRPQAARFTETDLSQVLHATRLAVLATDEELILPASYLFEVPILSVFLTRIGALVARGVVHYSSHIADLDSYVEHKAVEYRGDVRNPYDLTPHRSLTDGLVWRPRYAQNTATDITESWRGALQADGQLAGTLASVSRRWPARAGDVETHLREVPERLEGRAFVGRFVRATVPVTLRADERTRVDMFLSREYLASYLRDLDAAIVADFEFGDFSCGIRQMQSSLADRVLSARSFDLGLRWLGIYDFVHKGARWRDLLSLRATPEFGAVATAAQHPVLRARLREAVIRGRKRIRFHTATTTQQAHSVVSIVANNLDVTLNQTGPDRRTR
ncbi:hypothetical protein ACIBTV_31065 [Micromonospora sp. NPDC049366]|uniref:hypothetical protein n=1 Tax=Micromonospora sp. NPDC049366 TaxID=3364271 RepID=UPI0037B48DEF